MKVPKMLGTTLTTFTVVATTPAGDIGFRELGSGSFRVRIAEYQNKEDLAGSLNGWNQPDESNVRTRRFSKVVNGLEALGEAIATGTAALVKASKGIAGDVIDALASEKEELEAQLAAVNAKYNAALAYA